MSLCVHVVGMCGDPRLTLGVFLYLSADIHSSPHPAASLYGLNSELTGTYSLLPPSQSPTHQEPLEKPQVAVISESPSLVVKAGQWGLC